MITVRADDYAIVGKKLDTLFASTNIKTRNEVFEYLYKVEREFPLSIRSELNKLKIEAAFLDDIMSDEAKAEYINHLLGKFKLSTEGNNFLMGEIAKGLTHQTKTLAKAFIDRLNRETLSDEYATHSKPYALLPQNGHYFRYTREEYNNLIDERHRKNTINSLTKLEKRFPKDYRIQDMRKMMLQITASPIV
jgi:hypothetical protein